MSSWLWKMIEKSPGRKKGPEASLALFWTTKDLDRKCRGALQQLLMPLVTSTRLNVPFLSFCRGTASFASSSAPSASPGARSPHDAPAIFDEAIAMLARALRVRFACVSLTFARAVESKAVWPVREESLLCLFRTASKELWRRVIPSL